MLELSEIQATILRYRPHPYMGTHIAVRIDNPADGSAFLKRLAPHIASAADWHDSLQTWIAVGISYAGLSRLGLPEASLMSFPEAFRTGMAARADHLADTGINAPHNWDALFQGSQVHIVISIFSDNQADWERYLSIAKEQFADLPGLTLLGLQNFGSQPGNLNPFGYRDGISEPCVEGSGVEPLPGQGRPVKAGEFILGYASENGQPLKMPEPEVLGRNSTFLAFRKYSSQVGAFNDYLKSQADTHEARELIAAKLVGRWRSGAPLMLAPEKDDPALGADYHRNNDFSYANDEAGALTPRGCHMRRMNPRDGKLSVLTDPAVHRLIRRGTTFGEPFDPDVTAAQDSESNRGIFFMLISAKAPQTLEFLQQEWINNGNFQNLGEERDPLIGLHDNTGLFTIPGKPIRKRLAGIQTFNILKGGEYLFMPSLPALRWIAEQQG
jgi:Dyp-type peroxidase family